MESIFLCTANSPFIPPMEWDAGAIPIVRVRVLRPSPFLCHSIVCGYVKLDFEISLCHLSPWDLGQVPQERSAPRPKDPKGRP